MKKFLALVKLLFVQQYRIKPTEGKKKKGGTIALIVILAVCMLPVLIGLAVAMHEAGKVVTDKAAMATMIILLCQGLVVIFGIQTLISNVFTVKDADKLLFLPMRSSSIFVAKLTVAYLNEVITTAVMILILLLPFGIGASAGFGFYVLLLLSLFLIPMLPLLAGSLIALPLSLLINKVGKNGVLKTVLQVILFLGIFVLYMYFVYNMGLIGGNFAEDGEIDISSLLKQLELMSDKLKYVHSDFTLANAMFAASFGSGILNLLISIAENALLLGLVVAMALPVYRWMLSTALEGSGGGKRKKLSQSDLQVKNKGVVKELIFTDLKRVSRESQMGFQSFVGLIMLPLLVVVFYFCFNMEAEEGQNVIDVLCGMPLYKVLAPIIMMSYMSLMGVGTNILGIYPITRENKSFYLIKSLPVPFEKYLLAKVILSTSVMLICDFLTCLLAVILFRIEWYVGILMMITMALLGFGGMCITTLSDLKSPKFGWTNFNQSLKNAKNSWMAMLVGFLSSLVVGGLSSLFIIWYVSNDSWYVTFLMWTVAIGVSLGFALVSYKIMADNAQRHFEKIEP